MPYPQTENRLERPDGVGIYYRVFAPAGQAKAALIICHGLADHSGRFLHVAEFFRNLGYKVYAYDHRGQGKSGGIRGHVDKFRHFYDDLHAVVKMARTEHPGLRVFVLGHSMGGLVALGHSIEYPKDSDGLIVTSPCLDVRVKVPPAKRTLALLLSRIMPTFAMETGIPGEHLCRDPRVVQAYNNDPDRTSKATVRFYVEFMQAMADVRGRAHELRVPILFMPASEDRIVCPESTVEFYGKAAASVKRLEVCRGLYHEILNEDGKEDIMYEMDRWMDSIPSMAQEGQP